MMSDPKDVFYVRLVPCLSRLDPCFAISRLYRAIILSRIYICSRFFVISIANRIDKNRGLCAEGGVYVSQ